jgi:hypothetical protein
VQYDGTFPVAVTQPQIAQFCAPQRMNAEIADAAQIGGYRAPRDGPVVTVRNGAHGPGHPSRGGAIPTGDIMASAAASS